MMWRALRLLLVYIASTCYSATLQAQVSQLPHFLQRPNKVGVQIQQGWYYEDGRIHSPQGAIDYINGKLDDSTTWQTFDVVAAADGVAIWDDDPTSDPSNYGNMVLIRHYETDSQGSHYFTLYAHLQDGTVSARIPKLGRRNRDYAKWVPVTAGEFLGKAGSTGRNLCIDTTKCIHLHFEINVDAYFKGPTDAYGVYKKRAFYPGPCASFLWSVCPPIINQPPTAGFLITSGNQSATEGQTLNVAVAAGTNANVAFSASRSSDPDANSIAGWEWRINGTFVSSAQSFNFALSAGTHLVSLIITDNAGAKSNPVQGTVIVTTGSISPPPHITFILPSSVVGRTFDLTINGTDFDTAGAVDQVFLPDGTTLVGRGTIKSRSTTQIVVTESMAGAAPLLQPYVVKVKNPDGQLSNGVPLTLFNTVAVSPNSAIVATVFSYTGLGFTGNRTATSHLKRPNGTEFPTIRLATSATGTFTTTIDSAGFAAGTYELWAVDDNTIRESAHVMFTVTAPPTCTLSAAPASITVGQSSTLTWMTTNTPTSASIDNGVGVVTPPIGGMTTVMPKATTTYTLTVTNAAGTNTCQAKVTVNPTLVSQQGGGPPGGNILAIAIDPSAHNVIYVGTNGGGVFKTTDGGLNWMPANSGFVGEGAELFINVLALAIDTKTSSVLYAVTDRGIFKSTDGARSWNTSIRLINPGVGSLAIDPITTTTIYVGTGHGVLKSSDGGQTWFSINAGLTNLGIRAVAVDPTNPNTVYVSGDGGVFASSNGGLNWQAANLGFTGAIVTAIAADPHNPGTVYLGAFPGGVFKSTDGGRNWTSSSSGITFVRDLAVDPVTSGTVYVAGNGGVFKTTDGAQLWFPMNSGLTPALAPDLTFVNTVAVDPVFSALVYAGTPGSGVFKSSNGGQLWTSSNSGLTASDVTVVAVDPATSTTVYAGTDGGVFKSVNSGQSWGAVSPKLANTSINVLAIDAANPLIVYAGTVLRGIFKSTDGAQSWTSVSSGVTVLSVETITAIVMDPINPTTLYVGTGGGGVFKSTDAAQTWNAINSGLTEPRVGALAIDPANPATLYAIAGPFKIFKTTNGGQSWGATAVLATPVRALVIDPVNTATLYATGGESVLKSTDGGQSWTSFPVPSRGSIGSIAIDPLKPATLYVGSFGVFKSTDGAQSWFSASSDISNLFVENLAVDRTTPATIYAATLAAGVFKSTDGGATWQPTGAN